MDHFPLEYWRWIVNLWYKESTENVDSNVVYSLNYFKKNNRKELEHLKHLIQQKENYFG
jgi:hypothetical protein